VDTGQQQNTKWLTAYGVVNTISVDETAASETRTLTRPPKTSIASNYAATRNVTQVYNITENGNDSQVACKLRQRSDADFAAAVQNRPSEQELDFTTSSRPQTNEAENYNPTADKHDSTLLTLGETSKQYKTLRDWL